MQTLIESHTMLHDGRNRTMRRIGSSTFAAITQYVRSLRFLLGRS